MTQLWAIQSKLLQEDSTKYLVEAFQHLGLNWAAFPLLPFVGHVPDLRWEQGPIVYYGSTALVKRVRETPELLAGARLFWDDATFQQAWYGPRMGSAYLNADARRTTVRDFIAEPNAFDQPFFIRPNSGMKIFAGKVFDFVDFQQFVDYSRGNALLSLDTEIVIGSVKKIEREFRTWVVDGEIAAAVQYKVGTRMMPSTLKADVPDEVVDFARARAFACSPAPIFVLDVAETPEGLRAVEINCFHTSGFYVPDVILDVVAEVSNYVKRSST
jgi:hypothetical protein